MNYDSCIDFASFRFICERYFSYNTLYAVKCLYWQSSMSFWQSFLTFLIYSSIFSLSFLFDLTTETLKSAHSFCNFETSSSNVIILLQDCSLLFDSCFAIVSNSFYSSFILYFSFERSYPLVHSWMRVSVSNLDAFYM